MDDDGYVNIVGRIKDMVDPRRREHLSARGRGVPLRATRRSRTSRWSACPTSATARSSGLVPAQAGAAVDAERLREYCRGRIAHYKVPRYVHVVDEFPMTVTGKVQKYKIREQATERLGLAAVVS